MDIFLKCIFQIGIAIIIKMKKVLFLAILVAILSVSCSSPNTKPEAEKPKVDVPELLLKRFAAIYPSAEGPQWRIGKNRTYEVDFIQDKQECTAVFLADGMVQQVKVKADVSAIPPAAATFIAESLGVKEIDGATKKVDAFGVLTWEVRIKQENYLFGSDGQLIGRIVADSTNESVH